LGTEQKSQAANKDAASCVLLRFHTVLGASSHKFCHENRELANLHGNGLAADSGGDAYGNTL